MTTALAQDLAGDLAAALDPCELARRIGLTPDGWQADLLRSSSRRQLVLCSRQSGKSTMAAIKAVHTAVYEPGSLTLLVSPSERQSGEGFKKCLSVLRALNWPVKPAQQSQLQLSLENSSRIVALPGKESTVRGYSSVRLLAVDEAARVSEDLLTAVRPMLSVSGGTLLMLSTPFGARGAFFEAWSSRDDTYERFKVTAREVPRISEEFLEQEKRALGWWLFEQEFNCTFIDATTSAFDSDAIRAAVNPNIKPLGVLGSEWT